jgi:hypothetical protein
VKGKLPTEHPKVAARWLVLSSLRLIGTIIDLEILTVKPVDVAKELRRALRVNKCLPHPSIIINVSSAYCRIGKSCEYCRGMGRLMSPCS